MEKTTHAITSAGYIDFQVSDENRTTLKCPPTGAPQGANLRNKNEGNLC